MSIHHTPAPWSVTTVMTVTLHLTTWSTTRDGLRSRSPSSVLSRLGGPNQRFSWLLASSRSRNRNRNHQATPPLICQSTRDPRGACHQAASGSPCVVLGRKRRGNFLRAFVAAALSDVQWPAAGGGPSRRPSPANTSSLVQSNSLRIKEGRNALFDGRPTGEGDASVSATMMVAIPVSGWVCR